MGRVYLAEDLRLKGQRWALKCVPPDAADPAQAEKEAAIMTTLRHPSLPRIVDYFSVAGAGCCLVMDYLEGETLLERSAAHGHALPWTTVVHYGAQLCELLDYLHSRDSPVVFRDVKPSNVIVGPDDALRLIDFGIARTYKEGKSADTVHVGSVGFAAPELLANRQTDHRADLYSLGSMLYFLLSGGQFYNFTKRPLREAAPGLPRELCEAVERLLEDDPARRFPDAKSAKAALIAREGAASGENREFSAGGSGGRGGHRTIVSIYGLFPKAGATFLAVAVVRLLAERSLRPTYASFPWSEGDVFLRMLSSGGEGWRDGGANWRLSPDDSSSTPAAYDAAALYKLLFELRGDVVVFDIPSTAEPEAAEALLRASDLVVAVAAPDPGGLRSSAAVANWRRLNECGADGRVEWAANRMPVSAKLPDFFSLFSARPIAVVPELPYDRVTSAKWRGRLPFDDSEVRAELAASLRPLLLRVAPASGRRDGFAATAKRWLANKWAIDYNKNKFHP